MKILHLGTALPNRHLIKACNDLGHAYDHFHPENLYLEISESTNGYDKVYNGDPELAKPERIFVKNYDAILTRIGSNVEFGSRILRHLNINLGIYSPQTAYGLLTARDKVTCTQVLSSHGIKTPKTVMAHKPSHPEFLIEKVGGLPAVGKLLNGSQGIGVILLESASQTNDTLESFAKSNISLKLQSYIDGKASDIRAIVVGDKVVVAMKRTAVTGFKANISKGATGEKVTLSQADQDICVKAAKACNLEFAGVDIMHSIDGNTYVIEVNSNAGTKIIDITGHNFFFDILTLMQSKVKSHKKQPEQPQAITKQVETNNATERNDLENFIKSFNDYIKRNPPRK